jgi:cell division protein FtsB
MRRNWLGWKYALLVIGVVILGLLVMDFNSRMADLRRLSDRETVVAGEKASLERTKAYMETQVAYATSEDAVRKEAYESLHMQREGDTVFVLVPESGSTPVPTVVPAPTPQPDPNWKIWLSLFVDQIP